MPAGERLAPMLAELVAVLRLSESGSLMRTPRNCWCQCRRPPSIVAWPVSEPSIGSGALKPGSLFKSQIPVRTWADRVDARHAFAEIDLVGRDGVNPAGPQAFTLTVKGIATGWTENRSVPDKTGKCVLAALNDIAYKMPFPILGADFSGFDTPAR